VLMLLAVGFEILGLYFYWLLLELEGLPLREGCLFEIY
jgi:hypothetical protein